MFTSLLVQLDSKGVKYNENGNLADALKDVYDPKYPNFERKNYFPEKTPTIVVKETNRPLCFIIINKNVPPMIRVHYLFDGNKTNWEHAAYIVRIFDHYTMINNAKTPESFIENFEFYENSTNEQYDPNRKGVRVFTKPLHELMDLDNYEIDKDLYEVDPYDAHELFIQKYGFDPPNPLAALNDSRKSPAALNDLRKSSVAPNVEHKPKKITNYLYNLRKLALGLGLGLFRKKVITGRNSGRNSTRRISKQYVRRSQIV